MNRRAYLGTVGAGLGAALAGCLGNGLDADEVEVIDAWLQVATNVVDGSYPHIDIWLEEGDASLETIEIFESEAGELSSRWDEDIEPKLSDLRDTDIDRTVEDETWEVDGADLADLLEEFEWAVSAVHTGTGAILDAEGDPDGVGAEDRATLEEFRERAPEMSREVRDLWYRDVLEQPPAGDG